MYIVSNIRDKGLGAGLNSSERGCTHARERERKREGMERERTSVRPRPSDVERQKLGVEEKDISGIGTQNPTLAFTCFESCPRR